ncbi:hypothetical protein ANN_01030 [Periplaneta americana]|uniref:Uncharacterized protein n=1 Tax=Periplaneta americana TaxID=6978 RepID=A0ABQ8TVC7_PERAM|nr:hypothetical protein ANN_01030 [Periplaneta americana]
MQNQKVIHVFVYVAASRVQWFSNGGDCPLGEHLVGPYILPNRLRGGNYLFVLDVLPQLLEAVPLALRQQLWFQHADYAITVRNCINEMFPSRWFGRDQDACLRLLTGDVLSATVPGVPAFLSISARIHSLRALPKTLRYLGRAVRIDPVLLGHLSDMNLERGDKGGPIRQAGSFAAGGLVHLILIHPINWGCTIGLSMADVQRVVPNLPQASVT